MAFQTAPSEDSNQTARKVATHKRIALISKFRLSADILNIIETRRYVDMNGDDRECTKCNLQDIEDGFYFILKCPCCHEIRIQYYIKRYHHENMPI